MERKRVRCRLCGDSYFWNPELYRYEDRQGQEILDYETISPDGPFFSLRGRKFGFLCPYCAESFPYHASTILVCLPDHEKPLSIKVYEGVAFDPDGILSQLSKNIASAVLKIARSISWTSVGPWRGFYAAKYRNGWALVVDGWHSSFESSSFSEKADLIMKTPALLGVPVLFAICPTSNVCALSISVFAPRRYARKVADFFGQTYSFGMRNVFSEVKNAA